LQHERTAGQQCDLPSGFHRSTPNFPLVRYPTARAASHSPTRSAAHPPR
jgi:hypothetical protein